MKRTLIAVAGLLSAASAFADEPAGRNARAAVIEALEDRASLPAQPPSLPDSASDRAREVNATVARGQKGQEERAAAHEVANQQAKEHARKLQTEAAEVDRGAASAARKNNADTRAATAQERSDAAKGHRGHDDLPGRPGGHSLKPN